MLKPDYDQSIVNLIGALAGTRAPLPERYPPLAALSALEPGRRPVALIVIDGLGDAYLRRRPDSWLARSLSGRLTSVFPTTTASAVTALALGVPALQHGIPGWFTYLRELGCVAAPLPFVPRGGGRSFSELGVGAGQLLMQPPLLPRLERPVSVVLPAYISDSPYSLGLYGAAARRPYTGRAGFFEQLEAGLREPGSPLVWGYWTELDALAHQYGMGSAEVAAQFAALDAAFEGLVERLRGLGALVVVTADHGLIDTAPGRRVDLARLPALQALLRLPLCGEPRAAFCYLKEGAGDDFDALVAEQLAGRFDGYRPRQLVEQQLFGRGAATARFLERVGDRVLLPRGNWVIGDRLLQERPFDQIGVHGGLSAEELYVPLVLCEP